MVADRPCPDCEGTGYNGMPCASCFATGSIDAALRLSGIRPHLPMSAEDAELAKRLALEHRPSRDELLAGFMGPRTVRRRG